MRAGTDARNRVELVQRRECAVLLAVVEDLLGRDRPHPRQRVELLESCDVEVDGPLGRRAGAGLPARRLERDDDLEPVRKRRREVHQREIGTASRPARARDGISDPRSVPKAVQPRPVDGSHHMDHELRSLLCLHRQHGRRGALLARSPCVEQVPSSEQEHEPE